MQALDVVIKEKFGSLTVEEAKAFVVTDLESKKVAAQRRDLAMDFKKIIVEFFKPHKQGAHKVWRYLCDSEAKYLLAPESLELTYKGKIQLYDRELIRIRQQAEQVERDRLKKLEEEMLRKREEEARKSMAASKQLEAKRIGGIAGMPRKRSKFKILLFLIIIAALVYLYLKYVMRII